MYYGCPLEHDAPKLVTLEHNEFKSTNEFARFCIELGEFPMNSSNCLVINKQINSLKHEQLDYFEYFNYLIFII